MQALGLFYEGEPCKTEKNFNLGEELRAAARKLIHGNNFVTPASCDVDINLGLTSESPLTSTFISWEAVSAIATSIAAFGVVFALWQIWLTRSIAQLQFEDALAREYRDLCTTIPAIVFLRGDFTEKQYCDSFDDFYRYLDLSNEQISLRQRRRIGNEVWASWCIGIEQNLALPAFARAWKEVKEKTQSFKELRALEASGFKSDPKRWPKPK